MVNNKREIVVVIVKTDRYEQRSTTFLKAFCYKLTENFQKFSSLIYYNYILIITL